MSEFNDFFTSGGNYNYMGDYNTPGIDYPDYTNWSQSLDTQYATPGAGTSVWGDGSSYDWAGPSMYDLAYGGSSGSVPMQGGQYSSAGIMGDITPGVYGDVAQQQDPSMWGSLLGKFGDMPFDKQVGLGMGVLNGLGSFMASKQTNKNNKKAAKIMEQEASMRRKMQEAQLKTSQIAHSWSDSVDPIAQAQTYQYKPLTAEQAARYGETGAPYQQMVADPLAQYSPNTGRIQLAEGGMAEGGEPEPYYPHALSRLPDLGWVGYMLNAGKGIHKEDFPEESISARDRLAGFGKNGAVGMATKTRQQRVDEEINGKARGGLAQCACGGASSHQGYALGGDTSGQSDKIPAMLSDGEYVFDADTVAALGDGNTKAGASALDQMRMEVRKHKRSAPINKIPPKAKPAAKYLPKKGKK
jgi:hypothetical protein